MCKGLRTFENRANHKTVWEKNSLLSLCDISTEIQNCPHILKTETTANKSPLLTSENVTVLDVTSKMVARGRSGRLAML